MTDQEVKQNSSVAIIVVNWNSWQLTLSCLAALRLSQGAEWHLFLVDNASTDDSAQHLSDLGDDVTLVRAASNGGWTGGNNEGVKAALSAGYEWFFILNSDAKVTVDTIAQLLEAATGSTPPPILGPVHVNEDGQYDFVGATVNPATGLPMLTDVSSYRPETMPAFFQTSYIRGAGLFVAREHFDRVGMFDDTFYLNYDETDWCFRAGACGYKLLMARDVQIVHLGSVSIGGVTSPLNVYFLVRNGLLFAERHSTSSQRRRQTIEVARWAARLTPETKTWRRIIALLVGRSRLAIAARAGARDYTLRRFGDCPRSIRTLSGSR